MLAGIAGMLASPAAAGGWPDKPVSWISPAAPGPPFDSVERPVAVRFADAPGHSDIIDNRCRAGGTIGIEIPCLWNGTVPRRSVERLQQRTGIKLHHVPYRDGGSCCRTLILAGSLSNGDSMAREPDTRLWPTAVAMP